jgi:DNA-binding GntR family transcriptional regulator
MAITSSAAIPSKGRSLRAQKRLPMEGVAPLARSVLSVQVSRIIVEGLLDGRLQPGDRLVENDLAGLLGVSRSPIREALTELTQSGVVVRDPGRGCRIRQWAKQDLEELFGVRSVLEGYAARLATKNFNQEARRIFTDLIEQMEAAGVAGDFLSMIELDLEFHRTLWRLSENSLLEHVLNSLSQQFRLFLTMNWRFHGGLENVAENHRRLLDKIASGDPAQATEAMDRHVVVEKMASLAPNGSGSIGSRRADFRPLGNQGAHL